MSKRIVHIISVILCALLVIRAGVGCVKGAYSTYYEPGGPAGVGMSLQQAINAAQAASAAGTPYIDRNGTPIYVNESTRQWSYEYFDGASLDTAHTPPNKNGSINVSTSGSNGAPASGSSSKQYSHEYKDLTDEAQEALLYFTHDGVPDSAYINVPMSSSENAIKGTTLNASTAGKEDLFINFIDKAIEEDSEDKESEESTSDNSAEVDNTITWHFSNVEVPEDYSLDLSAEFVKDEGSEYPDTYTLSFTDGKTVSDNTLEISIVNKDFADGDVYRLYMVGSENEYEEKASSTVSNNSISYPITELVSYTVSKTDIIAEQEAKAEAERKAEEEAKAAEEASKAAEEAAAKEAEEKAAEEASKVEQTAETSSDTASVESQDETDTGGFPILPVAGGCAAILVIIIVILMVKKNSGSINTPNKN